MASKVMSFAEAAACVDEHASLLALPAVEQIGLEQANGRVLAQQIVADRAVPAFDRSTRDGFAVLSSGEGPRRVLGEVRAGDCWRGPKIEAETCVEIMTGAPLPEGADAVVMLEHCERRPNGPTAISMSRKVHSGENVVAAGSEAQVGQVLLWAGSRLNAAQIGLAAACGYAKVAVFRRPRVAVLATGDELVNVANAPGPQQIRNSNSYALRAAVERAGGVAVVLPPARDTHESLAESLVPAFECDLVLLTGGVSAGKYDLAEEVLAERFGAEFLFTGVKMQPGRPVVFGRDTGGKLFFGLPGNPVSTLVTFAVLAQSLLRAMGGERGWRLRFASATLEEDVAVPSGLMRFLPARIEPELAGAAVRRIPWQGSGDMAALAASNGYLVLPEKCGSASTGDSVTVLYAD